MVEERGSELEEGEGHSTRFSECGAVAEAEDYLLELRRDVIVKRTRSEVEAVDMARGECRQGGTGEGE